MISFTLLTAACEGICDVLSLLGGAGAELGGIDALETSAGIAEAMAEGKSAFDVVGTEINAEQRSQVADFANELANNPSACRLPNSFAGGTRVLMADGTTRQIKDIKIGDQIANAEPDSPRLQRHRVENIHVTDTDRDFVDLTVATPDGRVTITTTAHHLFWNATAHAWHSAADLKSGAWLDTPRGGHAKLIGSHRYAASIRTYNLTVSDVHTYYVLAGRTPVLVHNGGCPSSIALGRTKLEDNKYALLDFARRVVAKMYEDWPDDAYWQDIVREASIPTARWRSTSASPE